LFGSGKVLGGGSGGGGGGGEGDGVEGGTEQEFRFGRFRELKRLGGRTWRRHERRVLSEKRTVGVY
jgi:hypothetical protein